MSFVKVGAGVHEMHTTLQKKKNIKGSTRKKRLGTTGLPYVHVLFYNPHRNQVRETLWIISTKRKIRVYDIVEKKWFKGLDPYRLNRHMSQNCWHVGSIWHERAKKKYFNFFDDLRTFFGNFWRFYRFFSHLLYIFFGIGTYCFENVIRIVLVSL